MLQAIVNNKTNKPRRHTVSVAIVGKTVIHLLANVVMCAIKMLGKENKSFQLLPRGTECFGKSVERECSAK